jgi:hypothetical protein
MLNNDKLLEAPLSWRVWFGCPEYPRIITRNDTLVHALIIGDSLCSNPFGHVHLL